MAIQENERKLAELILYICQKCANDVYFGAVKLHKILFFSDFAAFGVWEQTITGGEYQHQPQGPTLRRLLPVQAELKAEQALALQPTNCFGFTQNRPVNLREPDLSLFSGKEIAMVDSWIDRLRPMSANDVSNLSHDTFGWRMTMEGQTIPEKTVFLSWAEPSEFEKRRGLELAKQYGLAV